jgi:hypothetical protein
MNNYNEEDDSDDDFNDTNIVEHKQTFKFYEFGVDKNKDLLNKISKIKQDYHEKNGNNKQEERINDFDLEKTSKTKTFSINDFQKTQSQNKTGCFSIANFHPKPKVWSKSYYLDDELIKQLYRIPCKDPSGKNISSLGRDEPKGIAKFKIGFGFPPLRYNLCSDSFQKSLLKHMDDFIEKVENEFEFMPNSTQSQMDKKTHAGADLANLKQRREEIRISLQDHSQNKDD